MKLIQATLATAWLTASLALAVPSEINYQGVLTDSQGNLVNGNQTMSLKIYDSPTGGTLLYSEDLGTVPVNNGVYNFTFGANGISNALTTEAIATTNGTASTFQKVLSASTVVAGSVTVTDGNYTWDQTNGSLNENDFGVSYSSSLRRATVTYYNGAPAAGKTISATYRTPSAGISGAIGGSNQPWLETTVNGTAQSPRQKILTVPFAIKAESVNIDSVASETKLVNIPVKQFAVPHNGDESYGFGQPNAEFPITQGNFNTSQQFGGKGQWQIPESVRRIKAIRITYKTVAASETYLGSVSLRILGSSWTGVTRTNQASLYSENIPVDLSIPFGETWVLKFYASPYWDNDYRIYRPNTGAEITSMSIDAEVVAVMVP